MKSANRPVWRSPTLQAQAEGPMSREDCLGATEVLVSDHQKDDLRSPEASAVISYNLESATSTGMELLEE